MKALRLPGEPAGIKGAHFPDATTLGKTMDGRDVVGMARIAQLIQLVEARLLIEEQPLPNLFRILFQKMEEDGALPGLTRRTLVGEIIDTGRVDRIVAVPLKGMPLEIRVERVHQDQSRGNGDASRVAAFAKARQKLLFRRSLVALSRQPECNFLERVLLRHEMPGARGWWNVWE